MTQTEVLLLADSANGGVCHFKSLFKEAETSVEMRRALGGHVGGRAVRSGPSRECACEPMTAMRNGNAPQEGNSVHGGTKRTGAQTIASEARTSVPQE